MASTIRIGLLDVDPDVRFGRKQILSSQPDFEVVFDSDGSSQDLDAIGQSLIDVLILDQRLVSGPGIGFYSNLRDLTGRKEAPTAILTSSFAQPALLLEALEMGISDLVTLEQGAAGLVEAASQAFSSSNSHSLASLKQLLSDQPRVRAIDLNFVRLVDELPERLSSNLRRLKSVWHKSDPSKLEAFDLASLDALVSRLPVSGGVELVLAMNRSGRLDVE